MPEPQISHEVDIHLTSTSGAVLSDTNKLEEYSTVTISGAHTVVARQNLNSDGHTKQSVTWHEYSGSLEYRVVRGSTVQETLKTAAMNGTAVFLHVIHTPGAGTGLATGQRYEIVFESDEETFTSAELVGGTASFKVSGAPVAILAP